MQRSRLLWRACSLFLVGLMLFPMRVEAAVSDVLRVRENAIVARGDFVRSAVILFGFSVKEGKRERLPFKRPVPRSLLPYLQAAHERGALEPFGEEFLHAQGITRGEAVQVIAKLRGLTPREKGIHFGDAPRGTALEAAVQIAVERGWLDPLRTNVFGTRKVVTGREATILLQRVLGEAPISKKYQRADIPVVHIKLETVPAAEMPQEGVLRSVWKLLNQLYLYKDTKLKAEEAVYKAIDAIVKSLDDPYTSFMRPVPAQEFQTQIQGEISGIGAQVEHISGILTVIAPLPGSPAKEAGLLAGDQILAVNGESLEGLGFIEAVAKVRGPKGSKAMLRVRRNGAEFDVAVMREVIRVPEIEISTVKDIAVVKLMQFGQTTEREFRSLTQKIQEGNPRGIILDLRDNPGGLLHAADIVLSAFLPEGSTVASIVSSKETYKEVTDNPPTIDQETRVVVLVNKGSASASEIVAGTLQDAGRAIIVGEKTFGKGTVQQLVDFNDGSSLKLTVAEWLTPKGRKIEKEGVTPDVVVAGQGDRDEQFLRALELLR